MAEKQLSSSSTRPPQFSVVIATRNRMQLLKLAIDSVLRQSIQDFEVIVVDDASETPVEQHDDPRVRVIRHEVRKGPPGAWNTGVEAARGEHVTFLADDDEFTVDRLEIAAEGLRFAPMAICYYRWMDEPERRGRRKVLRGNLSERIMDPRCTPSLASVALRRDCWEGMDERFLASEDVEYMLRSAQRWPVWTIPRFGYLVRRHDGIRDIHGPRARVDGMNLLLEKHRPWFEQHPKAAAFRTRRIGLTLLAIEERDEAMAAFRTSLRIRPNLGASRDLLRGATRRPK